MHSIYLITNKIDGKVYVGQTSKTVKQRWNGHVRSRNSTRQPQFFNALRKYGKDGFIVQEVATAETQNQIDNLEKLWIIVTRSFDKRYGYNSTLGGDGGMTGYHHSDEAKKKIGKAASILMLGNQNFLGMNHSEEAKLKIGAAQAGKVLSDETKHKISIAKTGKKHSEETKLKMGNTHRGFKHSEESKRKMSEIRKAKDLEKFLKTVAWG